MIAFFLNQHSFSEILKVNNFITFSQIFFFYILIKDITRRHKLPSPSVWLKRLILFYFDSEKIFTHLFKCIFPLIGMCSSFEVVLTLFINLIYNKYCHLGDFQRQ